MKEITANPEMVAYCGLYCGACRSYLKGSCPGCHENVKAGWCKIRTCGIDHGYVTCVDCEQYDNPQDCKLLNNIMAKFFALIFRSDRAACLRRIKEAGVEAYAGEMAASRRQSLKK